MVSGAAYPVSAEKRERVMAAVRELDFKLNCAARQLRSKKSVHIAAIVPSLNNPFYSALLSAVESEAASRGYVLQVYSSGNDPVQEERIVDLVASVQIAGLLVSSINWCEGLKKKVASLGAPAVLFDQVPPGYEGHFVGFDFMEAGAMAARFLAESGHKRIALGMGDFDRESRRLYRDGFLLELKKAGLEDSSCVVSPSLEKAPSGIMEYELGIEIARLLLLMGDKMPTAVAVFNDIAALGVIKGLEARGVRVPSDVSVLGFDDIPYGFMTRPALSTIRQDAAGTGRAAARLCISLIEHPEREAKNIVFRPELVKRESVLEAAR